INPADTREVCGEFADSTPDDSRAAVEGARKAFQGWRLTPAPRRAEILYHAAEMIVHQKNDLARDMTREMGKVLKEAAGDVQEAIDMTYYIAGEGRRLHGHTTPSELPNKYMMSQRVPLGVAAMITPWNFPMAIPSWKIIPALVSGNTVVLRPSPEAPLSAHHFVRILHEAGIPPGVINLVTSSGKEAAETLVQHPDVPIVSFTGSTRTGQIINEMAAPMFKRISLEMGGKNAIIIMDDADLHLATEGALWGGFGTTGQRCTAASRLIVHEKVHNAFLELLLPRIKALRVGNGLDSNIDMGPIVNETQLKRVESYVQAGRDEGAKLFCGGERLSGASYDHGYFYAPTVFTEVTPRMKIAREEIFGPVVAVLRCKDLDEGIAIANDTQYGLSSSIYTENVHNAFRAMSDLNTGITYINAPTIGAEVHLPFGGTKQTGNGHREGGPTVLDLYTEWKTIYIDFSGRLQKAQIDS
ncbi:MAG TPA: aldehyde dehydrogenase family protein, partial [Acidobacteriota bacterium]|nr:aldehyde dehydrogenase family protein [Acidobacteriota bacterium]